ncbi:MAG: hypothetical protein ABGX17_06680 [Desulfurobacteriaceae bacterium]
MINSSAVGNFFFWFFFIVTIAWTVIAILIKGYKMLKIRLK